MNINPQLMKTILLFCCAVISVIAVGQTAKLESLKYFAQTPPYTTPAQFAPGIVSLPDQHEFGSVFNHDGTEFYYGVDTGGKAEIRFMKLNNGKWTKSERLLFDPVFSYNDPMLSIDQKRLYFISDRPLHNSGEKKDYDIWYIDRSDGQWSAPVNAGTAINSPYHEYYVSFANNGSMYFSSNRKIKAHSKSDFNILTSAFKQGDFEQPAGLSDSINTFKYEADVFVSPDESFIIFCADRPEGFGMGDLYISFRKSDGTWTKSKNMGKPINTELHELCPFVSRDGKYFFYTSNKDIYWVDARIIEGLR
jgi:Tol biopolymer transport system component